MKKIISLILSFTFILNSLPLFSIEIPLKEKTYYISPGDTLNMNVYPAEEFSKELLVQPDGSIDIPLIGQIKVLGMKAEDLEKILTSKFSKYVSNPSITINIRKFSAYKVAIIGQVHFSGYFEYYEGMKVLDLIATAGGFSDYANEGEIRVFRKTKDENGKTKEESFKINLDKLMKGKVEDNINLLSGDIVYVPKKNFPKFTKWITDNIIPWTMLATFGITIGIISSKR